MKILWINDGTGSDGQLSLRLSRIAGIMLIHLDDLDDVSAHCAFHNPDLVVIDICPLDNIESGYIDSIKQGFPNIKFCIVFSEDSRIVIKKAWAAGADIVVPNTITPGEFMQLYKYSQKDYCVFPKGEEK